MTQSDEKREKSNISQFPGTNAKKNLHPSDVKKAGIDVKELDAKLEKILLEQVLQGKAVWGNGVL